MIQNCALHLCECRVWNVYGIILYYGGIRCGYAIKTKLRFTHNVLSYVKIGKYTASAASKTSTYVWSVELAKAYWKLEIISVIKTN